jgi:GH15 family glucan-1,4-alpha-glucosidase
LQAFLLSGYTEEAAAWARWLRRAVAGSPGELQIMYGVGGERRLTEIELDSLSGYEGSKPVRVGNNASTQFQLDVFGEVLDSALTAARNALAQEVDWDPDLVLAILDHLETVWDEPDNGIWEVRGPRRQFTHSKVMAWVAFDRAIRLAEEYHTLPADRVPHWRQLRDRIHAEVCDKGFDPQINSFTQYYGSKSLDASLLMLAPVGFLAPGDPRIAGTVAAIQEELVQDGFVRRYQSDGGVDGLTGHEGTFLMTPPPGWRTTWPSWAAPVKPGTFSSVCSGYATTSACFRKNTTPPPAGCSGTSLKPSHTSR